MTAARPSRRRLRAASVVAIAAFAVIAAVSAPTAASAESGDLTLSLDGIHFSDSLPSGIFDGSGLLVPGDQLVQTLWVKNASSIAGDLRISRSSAISGPSALSRAITVRDVTTTVAGQGAAVGAPACSLVAVPGLLEPGQSVAIPLTLTMSDLDGRVAQNERLSLVLLAGLSEITTVQPALTECPSDAKVIPVSTGDDSVPTGAGSTGTGSTGPGSSDPSFSGPLAFTGSTMFYPSIMAGSVLTGIGLFFLLAARRRRREESM